MARVHGKLRVTQEDLELELWIRIGFIADQDPAFYINVDLDFGSREPKKMRIHADPDLGHTFKPKKLNFYLFYF